MNKVGTVLVKELREGLPVAIFFLFLFHMISATKAVSLGDYDIDVLRATTATIFALLVAKSILVVEALPISKYFPDRGLIRILWKTGLYGLVVLVFRFIEELIHSLREHVAFSTAVMEIFQGISWPVFWIVSLWVLSGLILYSMLAELAHALGPDRTRELFFRRGSEQSE